MLGTEGVFAAKAVCVQVGNIPGLHIDIIKAEPLVRRGGTAVIWPGLQTTTTTVSAKQIQQQQWATTHTCAAAWLLLRTLHSITCNRIGIEAMRMQAETSVQ